MLIDLTEDEVKRIIVVFEQYQYTADNFDCPLLEKLQRHLPKGTTEDQEQATRSYRDGF